MADDPILKMIQGGKGGGGIAVSDDTNQDPILNMIRDSGRNATAAPSTPPAAAPPLPPGAKIATPAMVGQWAHDNNATIREAEEHFLKLGYTQGGEEGPQPPALAPSFPTPTDQELSRGITPVTQTITPLSTRAANMGNMGVSGLDTEPTPEEARAQIAKQDAARKAAADQIRDESVAAAEGRLGGQTASEAAAPLVTGPKGVLNLPIIPNAPVIPTPGGIPSFPLGVPTEFVSANEMAKREENPAIPKTRGQAFWQGVSSDAIKNINDMFLSPIGLAATALDLTGFVALARAGKFGTDAAKLGQEYIAMREAGATGAELADVERQMQAAAAAAAKAQKVSTFSRKALTAGGAGFGAQGAVGVGKGIEEKNPAEILGGLGQIALGGAGVAGAGRAGDIEAGVQAETARRVAENLKGTGEVKATRTQQVTAGPPQLPPTHEPVGAGEETVPEKPETVQAQVDALEKGTNKVVYIPKGTETLPAPPENAEVTVVKGDKPGAGTYYHDESVTPEKIKEAVKDGTYGELLGHVTTKEQATAPGAEPAVVVARTGPDGTTEAKSSVVDASKPEEVKAQAEKLSEQFPGASIGIETPEQVIAGRQTPAKRPPEGYFPLSEDEKSALETSLGRPLTPEDERLYRRTFRVEEPPALQPNASGESEASLEAINRQSSEKAAGTQRIRIDTRSGNETPLIGPEAVDAKAGPYDRIVQRKADGTETVLDEGPKAKAAPVPEQHAGKILQMIKGEQAPNVYDLGEIEPEKPAEQNADTTELAARVADIEGRMKRGGHVSTDELRDLRSLMSKIEASHAERKPAGSTPSVTKSEKPTAAASEATEAAGAAKAAATAEATKNAGEGAEATEGKPAEVAPAGTSEVTKNAEEPVQAAEAAAGVKKTPFELGKEAHAAGKPRVAMNDENLKAIVSAAVPGGKWKEWYRGWDAANVAAPEKTKADVAMERIAKEDQAEREKNGGEEAGTPMKEVPNAVTNTPGIKVTEALHTGVPGLAVTKLSGGNGTDWTVTHINSGRKIGQSYDTSKEALEVAKKIGPLTDWTKSKEEIQAVDGLGKKVVDALGKSQAMMRAEDQAREEEPATKEAAGAKIEPEKESTNGEATEPVGGRSKGALAEVPPENVQAAPGERPVGERAEQGGGEGEEPVRGQRAGRNERAGGAERGEEAISVPAERGGPAAPRGESRAQSRPGEAGNDYRITEADRIGEGTVKEKYNANVDAIRTLNELEAAGRPATPAEQSKLVRYSGWGWSGNLLNEYHDQWRNERKELQGLLSEDEYRSAVESTKNAHYTSPEIIKPIWDAVRRLGFTGGRILEPSAGVGHFFGLMPNDFFADSRKTAIELDKMSGRILKQLYQTADVRIQGFEELKGLDNFYDLAISNVPFGDYKVHDPAYNKYKLSIHNYFITKMLDKVRPGGLAAIITSHFTLDNYKSAIRQLFLDRGDLLGAIRLPGGVFEKNAGTDVTTDVLFFRKRGPDEKPASEDFLNLKPVEARDKWGTKSNVEINEYFIKHPDMALGEHTLAGTQYGYGQNYKLVAGNEPIEGLLKKAIESLPENAMKERAVPESVTRAATAESIPAWGDTKPFGLAVKDGKVYQSQDGQMVHLADFPKERIQPLKDMLGVRNATREVFQAESKGLEAKDISEARGRLNRLYDAFVKKHGYLNSRRNLQIMADDPDGPLLAALEKWDSKNKTASKADVFFKQTIAPRKEIARVERAEDALPASLAEKGKIDFGYMSKISGLTPEALQDSLRSSGQAFKTPQGHWETKDEYLSGDVRKKLRDAEEAAKVEPEFKKNAEALKTVQPRDLEPGEIGTRLGTPWIPEDDVAKFIDEQILNAYYRGNARVTHVASEGIWKIEARNARYNEAARTKWGTERIGPVELIEQALNLKRPTIYDRVGDKSVVNEKETLAAREKLEQIEEAFQKWLFSEPERAERLTKFYNENFVNLVDRDWDGSHLTFPGKTAGIEFRPHQTNGIWRSLVGGNTLFAHVVGAGKTFTIVGSAMEARRLGLAKKSMVVVPNHLVEQWAGDWLRLYPQARILAATKEDFEGPNRKKLMSKIATGDWDAVIVPHASFGLLPVSGDTYKKYAQRQLDMISEHIRELSETEGKKSRTVKELSKIKARVEARMKKALNRERKDNTINFEETGVDRLYVDEAHMYKNLFFSSKMGNINGIPKSDAQRAFDMYLKAKYISDLNNGSGVMFATGTPISNTMAEIYTMMRYMDEGRLEQAGMAHFDSWAANFGQTVQNMEVSPEDPTKFRISTRFAKFKNVSELKRMFRQNADVILPQDLEGVVKVPDIMGGKPKVIEVPASQRVLDYIQELGTRAAAIRKKQVQPDEDNMLKITSEGRKIALDYRSMFPGAADDGESKIAAAASKIAEVYHATRETKRTQAVMLDLMTPSETGKKKGQFNAYADLKNKLVGMGVPADKIAFIHDAKSDQSKQDLFDKVNAGDVAVILGSSDKMGVGTNIQERLVALHHIDAPWRPSDIEQREGRILRQGNTNPIVQIYRYVTSGTFDAYMWSTISRKAQFIRDMMQHGYDMREMEDADSSSLSYAEAAAIATGDQRVLEKVKTDADVDRLQKLKTIHDQSIVTNQVRLAQIPQRLEFMERGVKAVRDDVKTRDKNKSDEFRAQIGKQTYTERKDAGAAINAAVEANRGGDRMKIGKFNGFDIIASGSGIAKLEGEAQYDMSLNHENPLGTIQSMERAISGMETEIHRREENIKAQKQDMEARKAEINKPFPRQAELEKALAKQKELNEALAVNKEDKTMAGARENAEYNEDFKETTPAKAEPEEEESIEGMPRRMVNPSNPEAGFMLNPIIELGRLVARAFQALRPKGQQPKPAAGTVPRKPPAGPQAQATAQRPREVAGNIRLDKLNAPEDVIQRIRDAAVRNKDEFNEQRRGKIPFAKTRDMAKELVEEGLFSEKDLARMKKGTALNAEELQAARSMLITSAKSVREAANKLKENGSIDNVLGFEEALLRHDGIQKAVSGAVAEAGRALSQQRMVADALEGKSKTPHERVLDALGGKDLSEEAAKRLAAIPEDDAVALNNFLRTQKQWTSMQKLEAYWMANVLSSPRTSIKKGFGDATLALTEGARRFVDVPVDKIMAMIQGRKSELSTREAGIATLAYIGAIPEGIRKASYILAHGFDKSDPLALEMPRKYEFPGGAKNPFNLPGRVLSAATKFFQTMAFQGELHAQAFRLARKEGLKGEALKDRAAELVQEPTDKMIDEAMKQGEFQTYTERPDTFSRILMNMRDKVQLPRGVPLIGGLHPLRFVIPFVQIPYNLTKMSFRYSPLGLLKLNDREHFKSPQATQTISQALIGTAILGLFAYLASKKLLTGGVPTNSAARDEFYRSGRQPYSIKIGNRWVSYKPSGPFALSASAVAAWYYRHENKETMPVAEEVFAFAGAMGQSLTDESFLRGMKNALDALQDPKRGATQFASGVLGGFVPMESALRTLSDGLDPTVRDANTMYDRIVAGLPVINKSVKPKLDVLGRPATKEGSSGWAALFPGGFAPTAPKGSIDAELDRLTGLGLKNVGFAGKHLTIDNYKMTLTDDEQQRYQEVRGAYLRSYLQQTFANPEYKQLTDQEKVQATEDAIRQAGLDAHDAIGDQVIAERLKKVRTASIPRRPPGAMAVARP